MPAAPKLFESAAELEEKACYGILFCSMVMADICYWCSRAVAAEVDGAGVIEDPAEVPDGFVVPVSPYRSEPEPSD